mgnify:CR=1 FL=1
MNLPKPLTSAVLAITLMAHSSWAQMATTQDLLEPERMSDPKAAIVAYIDRTEVSAKLEAMGVDTATAKERVAALTDEEASYMAAKIDTLPAGGDALGSLIGAAVFIFIVLLITDLLGWTKVFNFTRPIVR